MGLRIVWTESAISQIEQIFDYYKYKASGKVAVKIVAQIVDRTIQLEQNPFIGAKEPLLSNRKNEYRYLVEGNYKIIYWIGENYVRISAVFDCRLNPTKMAEQV